MVPARKLLKRYVLVIGVAATGLFTTAFGQFNAPQELYGYVMRTMTNSRQQAPTGIPDILTTKELISVNGFGYEQHKVQTEDGYILKVHRILTETPGGPPVMIQHGFIAASDHFLVSGRNESLAFILADAGFDVWLTDQRGNWYSREHVKYKTSDPRYWDFTFQEFGYYDEPAFIDHILKVSGYSQLFYIGHSLGTTVFLTMAATRPEYNDKIKCAVLLAPVAMTPNLKELTSSPIRLLLVQADTLWNLFLKTGTYEFGPRTPGMVKFLRKSCSPSVQQDYCLDLIGALTGEHRDNLDRNEIGNQICYFPAGTSAKTAHHISQIYRRGFRYYDYGLEGNRRRYGSEKPPFYPLQNITSPVAIFWAANDVLVNKRSALELAEKLPNLVGINEIADPKFTHTDYIFGINKVEVLYNKVVTLLLKMVSKI